MTNILLALLCFILAALLVVALVLALVSIRIVPDDKRLVMFRGGRSIGTRGPGQAVVLPVAEKASRVELREQAQVVESFRNPTRDGAHVSAQMAYYYKVTDPQLAASGPAAHYGAVQAAILDELAAAIRSQALTEVLQNKQLADQIRNQLADRARSWGIEITPIQLRNVREAHGAED